jgi:hypothetical protein
MTDTEMKQVVLVSLFVVLVVFMIYQYDPSFFGLTRALGMYEGFEDAAAAKKMVEDAAKKAVAPPAAPPAAGAKVGFEDMPSDQAAEGFADVNAYQGPAQFSGVEAPAGCYPRDQLTPSELLPKDMNSVWAEQNPMGPGSLKGKNFLSAGALIGVNTVGQSMRNANLQVRSEPPNPQVAVSIFNQTTISPDVSHRPLEIGS